MTVFAFILVFVIGAIAWIFGSTIFAMRAANMTWDELCECGCMIVEAGNNRRSEMTLVTRTDTDAENYYTINFEKT